MELYVACFLLICVPILAAPQGGEGVQEDVLMLEVKIEPETLQQTANLGKSKVFTCSVQTQGDIGDQTPTLQWFFNDAEFSETSFGARKRISVSNNEVKLYITDVREEDAGTYRCDGAMAGQTDSKYFILEIFEEPQVLSEKEQHGIRGEDGRVECTVTGKPTPTLSWGNADGPITSNEKYIINSDNTMTIKTLTLEDDQIYSCNIEVEKEGYFSSFQIQYTVAVPPTITDTIQIQPEETTEGVEVRMTCNAEGIPQPSIYFMKGDNRVEDSKVSGNVLIIPSLQKEDEAEYFCHATNIGGEDVKSTKLNVMIPPKVTIRHLTQGQEGDPVEGQTVSIICEAEGDPEPSIKWRKENMDSYYGDGVVDVTGIRFEEAGNDIEEAEIKRVSKTMIFDSIKHQDAGKYTCFATNSVGDVEAETSITIRYPPDFNTGYDQTVFYGWKGHKANLTCQTTSNPAPTYRWHHYEEEAENKLGKEITTQSFYTVASQQTWEDLMLSSSSLMIDMSTEEAMNEAIGKYVCEAANNLAEGRQTRTVELVQAFPPNEPTVETDNVLTTVINLKLTAPKENGGQEVTGFSYKYYPTANTAQSQTGSKDLDGEETMVEIEGLQMNTDYMVEVSAVNSVGPGTPNYHSVKTLDRSKPLRLKLTSEKEGQSATSFTLSWEQPQDGESPISEFIIKYTEVEVTIDDETDDWEVSKVVEAEQELVSKSSSLLQFTIPDLKKDTYYQVQVSARNQVGVSDPAVMLIKTSRGTGAVGDSSTALASGLVTVATSLFLACLAAL